MDFDLFEQEDDFILSEYIIPNDLTTDNPSNNALPEFTCLGEDIANSQFSDNSFLKNLYLFNEKTATTVDLVTGLTKHNIRIGSMHSSSIFEYIVGRIRMNIQALIVNTKYSKDIETGLSPYELRREITLFLQLLRAGREELEDNQVQKALEVIRTILSRIISNEMIKNIYLANSPKGNENSTPAYHFLHGFLEWRFLDLVLLYESSVNTIMSETDLDLFSNQYQTVLNDLINVTTLFYKKKNIADLLYSSPFPCTCLKEMWLLMQLLIEKSSDKSLFWQYFNKGIEQLKNQADNKSLTSQNMSEITVWLLRDIVKLQGYKLNGVYEGPSHHRVFENLDFIEGVLEAFLNSNPSEENLRVFLFVLSPILYEWWTVKVDIPMILWEYFHKKLNSPFFILGSAPDNLAITNPSGKAYLDKIKLILDSPSVDPNQSSFTMFLSILGKTISQLMRLGKTHQAKKMLGRIYSKFSASKFLALNETGIHHLTELFLVLALCADLKEIATQLKGKLLSIPLDKVSLVRQLSVIKGHMALLILLSEHGIDMSDYIIKLLDQLASIKNDLSVLKLIAESLQDILFPSHLFDRGENLLIDSWMTTYLNKALPVEQERLLETLHAIFVKINSNNSIFLDSENESSYKNLVKALIQHVLPFVKQNFVTSFSVWIPILSADFCITNIGQLDTNHFQKLFRFFIDANCLNKESTPKFLLAILSSSRSGMVESSIIVSTWLKSLVLLSANNEDVVSLTAIVVTLDDFHNICDINAEELLTAKEPLCVFISSVGRTFDNCQDLGRKYSTSEKFNSYLALFDKWLSDKNEKAEVSFRFYSFIAIVIYNCSKIVYAKSKITCFFHIAMTRFILPPPIQMEKPPDVKFAQMIHKIWPVIVQGIGKLYFKTDPYLTKTLTDLILKWTPHFKISPNIKIVARPFVTCTTVENEELSGFIFDKLSAHFIAMQRRQTGPHACLVLTIFQEIVEASENDVKILQIFLNRVSLTVLEHIMMADDVVPSKKLCIELLKKVVSTNAFKTSVELKDVIIENLKLMAVKHLSYFTFFYFELLTQMVNICLDIVQNVMDFLKDQIKLVEQKRGGGEDGRLRTCYEKLNGAVIAAATKK